MQNLENLKKQSRNAHVLMKADLNEDANTRWVNKPVLDSMVIYDGKSLDNLVYKDTLKCEIKDNHFVMYGSTFAEGKSPRPTLSVTIKKNIDLSKYNRL